MIVLIGLHLDLVGLIETENPMNKNATQMLETKELKRQLIQDPTTR